MTSTVDVSRALRVVVLGTEQPLGRSAADGLRRAGAVVVERVCADRMQRATAESITSAAAELGGIDALVVSGWSAPLLSPRPFEEIDDETFAGMWEDGMQGMLWSLQAAIPHLRATSGSVVVLLPTTGMTGGAQYAVAAATFEAQRILAKSAARQLAPEGIRVNSIAVGAELVLADAEAAEVHYLAPSAGDGVVDDDELAATIGFVVSPAARHLSGQTITIDGGRWLAP